MNKRRICVVSGSRADYGLLYPLLLALRADADFDLRIAVTGMHLSPAFGLTYREIENDGFDIAVKIETLLSSDSPAGAAKSVGLGVIAFVDAFQALEPEMVVVLGDRYEIFAAAQAALFLRVPLIHICGGDSTEGAIDEAIRHSVTKMAHIHFASSHQAAQRIVQMGEDPERVFNVGSPGLDALRFFPCLNREALERKLDFTFRAKNLLVTFHPVTLASDLGLHEFEELIKALESLGNEFGIIFTGSNADPSGRELTARLKAFVASHPNSRAYTSLGQQLYYSAISQVDVVVGNSSSGLYEVPSFKKPTVNIGVRQRGREAADSVIHCVARSDEIAAAVREALQKDCSGTVNPYGDGHAVERMMMILRQPFETEQLLMKKFHPIPTHE